MLTWEERLANLTETVGDPGYTKLVQKIIAENEWKPAMSYAEFCPHEYTLRRSWKSDADYGILVRHIWLYGMDAQFGKQGLKRYWFDHEGGYYYFLYPEDTRDEGTVTKESTLINRGKICNYNFWIEDDLLGSVVKCKVKPRALWHPEDIKRMEEAKAKRLEDKKNA